LHIGTGGTSFNSETLLFYKELGAKRIVLDRHLNVEEFKQISLRTKNDMELEAMILNQKCKNIDGLCAFQHGFLSAKYKGLARLYNNKISKFILGSFLNSDFLNSCIFKKELGCCLDYKISEVDCKDWRIKKTKDKNIGNFFNAERFLNKCGACTIYDLDKMGITFFKIIGRENLATKKIQDVRFLNYCKKLLAGSPDKKEYSKAVTSFYKELYGKSCTIGNCYYS
jgi:putative protease